MFHLSSLSSPTLKNMKHQTSALMETDTEQVSSQYQMKDPFKLELFSLHPENPEHFFSMTLLAPDNSLYTMMSKEEMMPLFSKCILHRHDYYELMVVLEGEVYQIIENKRYRYQPGCCCLLNKNVYHTEEHSTDYRLAFLSIDEDFLKNLLAHLNMQFFQTEKKHIPSDLESFLRDSVSHSFSDEKKYFNFFPKKDQDWLIGNLHDLLEQISLELLSPRYGSSYIIEGLIAQLLLLLADKEYFNDVPIQIGTKKESALFHEITELMMENNGRISRSQISEELHYSADYVNKVCKKYSGMSLHDYGMSFCMQKASTLLLETNLSIEEIAFSLDFVNRTNFYRQFQQFYGTTPAKFRRENRRRS